MLTAVFFDEIALLSIKQRLHTSRMEPDGSNQDVECETFASQTRALRLCQTSIF